MTKDRLSASRSKKDLGMINGQEIIKARIIFEPATVRGDSVAVFQAD